MVCHLQVNAIGDFGDLIKDAAKAKAELAALQKQVEAEGAAEVAAATKAADARQKDLLSLQKESQAYQFLEQSAKAAAVWTDFGGRSSMAQHLSDLQQEMQWETLLNRQRWLGFSSPQAAYSWRQLELYQHWLMNRAQFGATSSGTGYSTPDQYLSYLQRDYMAERDLSDVLKARADIYRSNADAILAYTNALHGTHATLGSLSQAQAGGVSAAQAYQAELAGVPAQVTTYVNFEDTGAVAKMAAYQALLRGIPRQVSSRDVLTAAYGMGGVPLPAALPPEQIQVSYTGPYADQYNQILAEVATLAKLKADIPVDFNIDPTEVAALQVKLGQLNVTELVAAHLATAGMGGGAGGGGGGPPPAAATPDPSDAHNWDNLAAAEKGAGDQADAAAVKLAILKAVAAGDSDAAAKLAYVLQSLGATTKDAGDKAAAAAGAGGFGAFAQTLSTLAGFGTRLAVFGGLLGAVGVVHLLIDAIIELVAVLVLATVGLAAAAAAVAIFIGVASQAQDTLGRISDRLKAVQVASQATGQAIYPLTQSFDSLASKIRPQVWQLYGDALNLVANRAGVLGKIALATGNYLDQLAAKIVVFVTSPGFQQGLTTLVKAGFGVLQQLGDIFRNLGQAILNFARVMQQTHIAEDLLAILNAAAKLIDLLSKLPVPLLAVVLGLHAFYLWGGLLATGVIALLDPIRALALAIGGVAAAESAGGLASLSKDASAWQRLKAVVADIANGFGSLAANIGLAGKASKVAASDAEAAAAGLAGGAAAGAGQAAGAVAGAALAGKAAGAGAADTAAVAAATGDLAVKESAAAASGTGLIAMFSKLGPLLSNVYLDVGLVAAALIGVGIYLGTLPDKTQKWISSLDQAVSKAGIYTVIGTTISALAADTAQLARAQATGTGNATELANAQADLSGKLTNELVHVGDVSKAYGVNMVGALNLLQVAGVKTSALFTANNKVWAAAMVQVAGLVQGYIAMGQGLTQLQGDVSVQLVMNADQLAQMQKLNTAWDSFITLVDSGQSAYVTFQQNLATTNTNAQAAGASLGGLNAQSLTLRSSYLQLLPQAGQVLDAIRSQSAVLQNGAMGSKLLTQATKDLAAEMIPLAGNNKAAQDSLLALAQQADPSVTTWQKLTQWVGKTGVAGAASDLNSILVQLETPVSNLAQDAAKLTTALQQDLNPAMAAAEFTALGGQQAFNTFATDLLKFGPNAQPTITAGKQVAEMLISINKSVPAAHDQFIAWAESMGLAAPAAEKLWATVSKGETPLSAVRDSLAKTSQSVTDLGKPGLWGQVEHAFMSLGDQIKAHPIADLIGGALNFVPGVTAGLDAAGHAIQNFLTKTLPGFFTGSFRTGVIDAWSHVWSALVAPVVKGFDDVEHAITSGFDQWWKTHGSALEQIWASITGGLSRIWDNFTAGLRTAWNTFTGWFSGSGNVGKYFSGPLRDLQTAWSVLWGAAVIVAKNAFALIVAVAKTAWDAIAVIVKTVWDAAMLVLKVAWDALVAIFNVAIDVLTGHWKTAWNDILNFGKQFGNAIWAFLTQGFNNFSKFFTQLWNNALGFLRGLWTQFWSWFSGTIINGGFGHFFASTIPGWFNGLVSGAKNAWNDVWGAFKGSVISPMTTFFTSTVPGWWNDFLTAGKNTLVQIGTSIEGGFKNAINWVITNIIGTGGSPGGIIGAIDSVIGVFGLHVNGVPTLAAGGPMGSVGGAGDSDSQAAWLTPGEWVLRKPARMALQSKFGPDFLPTLNYADQWLGSGARGPAASQGGWGYQGGGPVGAVTHFLGGLTSDVIHLGSIVVDLAKESLKTGFDAFWSAVVSPLMSPLTGDAAPGKLMAVLPDELKSGIDTLLGGTDVLNATTLANVAAATAAVGGSATPGVITVAKYVMSHGGNRISGAGVGGVIAGESGGNPEILQIGGGGGAGLLQWTPASSAFPIQPIITGNVGRDMAVQLVDMMAYIASRGGIASLNNAGSARNAAWLFSAMEAPAVPGSDIVFSVVDSLYAQGLAGGGPVGYMPGMASGGSVWSYPAPTGLHAYDVTDTGFRLAWNAVKGPSGQKPGSYTIETWQLNNALVDKFSTHPGWTDTAEYGYGGKGLHPGWTYRTWVWPNGGPKAPPHAQMLVPLLKAATGTGNKPPAAKAPPPETLAPEWSASSATLNGAAFAEEAAFWALMGQVLPKSASSSARTSLTAWDRALQAQQLKTFGLGRTPPGAYGAINLKLNNPSTITPGEWSAFGNDLNYLISEEAGTGIAGGINPPGTPRDSGYVPWHYFRGQWQALRNALLAVRAAIPLAQTVWNNVSGPNALPSTPGISGGLPGSKIGGGGLYYNLEPLITGGPGQPVFGYNPSPSMGFAGGGMVDPAGFAASLGYHASGGPIGLGQVAGMFGGIMPVNFLIPTITPGGIPDSLLNSLSSTRGQGSELPRRLSQAGAAHKGPYLNVENMTIQNPVAEQPSLSISRATNRLAFLAGRGEL